MPQDVEDQLRSALLQIQKSSAHLPTRQGCTFALHVEAHEEEGARAVRHDVSQVSVQVRRATALYLRVFFVGIGGLPGSPRVLLRHAAL